MAEVYKEFEVAVQVDPGRMKRRSQASSDNSSIASREHCTYCSSLIIHVFIIVFVGFVLSYTLLCVPYCPYNNFRTLNIVSLLRSTILHCALYLAYNYIGMTFVMKAMVFIVTR